LRWVGLPFMTHDMQDDLLNWFDYIVKHGHFAALSDHFYNYAPPYIYLMMAVSYLDGFVDRVTLIKSMSLAFDCVAAFLVYKIAMIARPDVARSTLLALLFLNLPTLILDGAFWGQIDVIYTAPMLAFAFFLMRDRPYLAMAMYGLAFTIKLQAIVLAPILAYLILSGIVPLIAVLLIPLVYALLCLPAALAGRGWGDLFTLYAKQVDIPHRLSVRAPNIWVTIQHFLPPEYYPAAVIVGTIFAAIVSVAVVATYFRVRRPAPAVFIMVGATLFVALEPSILPKMHERYFFPADLFAFCMAIFIPRAWWIVVLLQIASILGYSWFMAIDHGVPFDLHPAAWIGSFAAIPATIGIAWYYWKIRGTYAEEPPARLWDSVRRFRLV
jgi:Gpi18-like mannosyltransferase